MRERRSIAARCGWRSRAWKPPALPRRLRRDTRRAYRKYYTWRQTVSAIEPATRMREPTGRKPELRATDTMTAFWVEVAVRAGDGTVAKLAAVKLAPVAKP